MILCIYLYFNSLWELSAELGVSRTGRAPTPNGPRCYCSLTFHLIPHLFLLPVPFFFLLKFPKKKEKKNLRKLIYIYKNKKISGTHKTVFSFGRSLCPLYRPLFVHPLRTLPFCPLSFSFVTVRLFSYHSPLLSLLLALFYYYCDFFFWGYKYHQDLGKRKKKALIWDQS